MYIMYIKIMSIQGDGTMALIVKGVAEVRGNFSLFLDEADERPAFISRRRKNYMVIPDHVIAEMVPLSIKVSYEVDEDALNNPDIDGAYIAECDVFRDVYGWGKTKEIALESFVEGLIGFCEVFYNDFESFSKAPNRKNEILPVIKIISILSRGGNIRELIKEGSI